MRNSFKNAHGAFEKTEPHTERRQVSLPFLQTNTPARMVPLLIVSARILKRS